jgi:DNA-binding NtrC family response regulator
MMRVEPSVILLDDDPDLLKVVGSLVKQKTGRECLGLRTLAELRQHRKAVMASALAILDINLGTDQPSGLDAWGWLRAERYQGKIVFLTGHGATHPLVERAAQMGEVRVYTKPLHIEQLQEMVRDAR